MRGPKKSHWSRWRKTGDDPRVASKPLADAAFEAKRPFTPKTLLRLTRIQLLFDTPSFFFTFNVNELAVLQVQVLIGRM